jgi:nitrite reductase/ring-hydroxylating ferredoxin subunit/DMSO/TMAO reductase YedYZ heme-binding membrane subunit
MSVKYIPVQWNKNKWWYDGIMLFAVVAYLWIFIEITPALLAHDSAINAQVHNARAFGSCAFLMLSVILAIGPLSRLDSRFLPLLYNRRHFGVMTTFIALSHAGFIVDWYFAFSKAGKYEALLFANTSYNQLLGFPFEIFGIFALFCLLVLATTSHDFWLKFLTPRVWKSLHYLIYAAYCSVVAHVSFGIVQDQKNQTFVYLFVIAALAVAALHVLAALFESRKPTIILKSESGWVKVCTISQMNEGYAKVARLPKGDRVAVFLQSGKLSAISNACAHQNGPLGEGKILNCLVTCPWHGFQYDVTNGRSPAPFTETVPTYNVAVEGDVILVDPEANVPGTFVEPVVLPTLEVVPS